VTGTEPLLITDSNPVEKESCYCRTLGKNPLIDQLVHDGKIDVSSLQGRWEDFLIQTVEKPLPNVDRPCDCW